MTLKEKVAEIQPDCINDNLHGGVCGCPGYYSYLNVPLLRFGVGCDAFNHCEDCWNQPFKEQELIIKEKRHTKSITWEKLWRRIGKQSIYKTQNKKVEVLVNGELKKCALVFTDNGQNFHLEVVE